MMDSANDAFLKKLLKTFMQEAKEHIDTLSNGLLELKKSNDLQRSKVLVEVLFREAHSLKGASRAVNIIEIEEVCKAMEDVFNRYKQSDMKMPNNLIEIMLESNDLLSVLSKADEIERRDSKPYIQKIIQRLHEEFKTLGITNEEVTPGPQKKQNEETETVDVSIMPEIPAPEKKKNKEAERIPTLPTMKESEIKKPEPSISKEETGSLETIRVPVKKLNAIMMQTEEMFFAKIATKHHLEGLRTLSDEISMLTKAMKKSNTSLSEREGSSHELISRTKTVESLIRKEIGQVKEDAREIDLIVDRLLDVMKEALMLPFSTLFYTLPKIVYDIAKSVGKDVALNVVGGDIEIDRRILEEMSDPLMHLLRNSIDHGIEYPEERLTKGKKEMGTITLTLTQKSGSKVEISILDDGAGINVEKIKDFAIKKGFIDPEESKTLDKESTLNLIFHSGISTSKIVTNLSGRGLGLAIVQEKAEQLGGNVSVHSPEEGGSEFRILLPLTMSTFRGVETSVNDQKFIFPSEHIARVLKTDLQNINTIEGKEMLVTDHHVVPFYRLSDMLELPYVPDTSSSEVSVVIITLGRAMLAIGVDSIDYEEEVMVKSLGKQLLRVKNIAGAALLTSDIPALILNISDLFKSSGMISVQRNTAKKEVLKTKQKILIADDSLTTRTLLQNIIEMVGYDVTSASDGLEAYEILKEEPFDLLISDVDMPRMNGIELTEAVRADSQLSELPIVLVTSLDSPQDKEKGMQAGANAYIMKSMFDQGTFLENIQWLID